jgi:ABC-type transport system involved in multi-copper enzyme maturation permease subunit
MIVVGSAFGVIVGVTIGIFTADRVSETDRARGERRYEQALDRCLNGEYLGPADLEDFGADTIEEFCAGNVKREYFGPDELRFDETDDILLSMATIVLLLGLLLGASLGGADWSADSMMALLTWEPRRLRIFAARAVAVVATTLVVTVLAQLILAGASAGAVALIGTYDGTPDGYVADMGLVLLRISTISCMFALMGLGMSNIARSTVSGVGIFLGYLILVEMALAGFSFTIQKVALGRATVAAVSNEALELFNNRAKPPEDPIFILQPGRGWWTMAAWAVVFLAAGVISFRTRDVT